MTLVTFVRRLVSIQKPGNSSRLRLDGNVLLDKVIIGVVALCVPLLLLLVWQASVHYKLVDPLFLPSLTDIFSELINLIQNGYGERSLYEHITTSLFRIFVAFFLGSFIGILLGLLMGYYKYVNAALSLITETLRPIPPLAFIPLFILWFGIGEVSKIMIILYSGMLVVIVNTIAGVRACAEQKILAGYSLGASDKEIFLHIILPSSLPYIMTGMRIALSVDFGILVASELLAGDVGLGFIIQDAGTFFNTKALFASIFLIGFLGVLCDRILDFFSKRLVHWEGK